MAVISTKIFKEKTIMSSIHYGCLKKFEGAYSEILDIEGTEYYMQRMLDVRQKLADSLHKKSKVNQNQNYQINYDEEQDEVIDLIDDNE